MKFEAPAPNVVPLGHRENEGRVHYLPILGSALVLRSLFALSVARGDPRVWFFNQASEYGCLAQSLLSGHGYASPFCGSTGPSAFLAPGYPLLVAAAFRLFGAYSMQAAAALISLQVLVGILIVLTVMLLAKRLLGTTAANLAGVLCAISPPAVCLPILFWETSLSMLLLTGIILLALRCANRPSNWRWLGFGAYCAVAMFVNPSLLLTFAAVFIWMIWQTGISRLRGPALALLTWCMIFSIWPIRNAYRLHAFVPLRTNLGYELWQGNRPGSDGTFTVALHPNKNNNEFVHYAHLGEAAYMQEKSELAIEAIKADKSRFVRLSLERFRKFWINSADSKSSSLLAMNILFTSLMSAVGLGLLFLRRNPVAWLLAIPFAILPAPYYLTHADFRFRLLLDPLAILLTAYVFKELSGRVRSHLRAKARGSVVATQLPART
ncbi:ArnT family glycosyltransferase [Granulicella aggregans]|uniref:ArnT family glycosyltransferase n=1 Tax=Granulicella aggregans TaxID=474949 RepID=UPI0021E0382F|nr:glycosyltransferase family 39 protein [Granulicella aggregans]